MKNLPSTYSLLIRSEEKGRTIFEHAVYAIVLLSVAFSGWEFAAHSMAIPRISMTQAAPANLAITHSGPQPILAVQN